MINGTEMNPPKKVLLHKDPLIHNICFVCEILDSFTFQAWNIYSDDTV